MKKIFIAAGVSALLFFQGCKTTYITSSWKAPDAVPAKFNRIMVAGIIREADRTTRILMEEHLVNELRNLGYHAVSAYDVYGPKAFQDNGEAELRRALVKDSIDAVLTIVLLDKEKERHYVPGRVVYSPYAYYHNRFYNYYHSLYFRIQSAGYYEVSTKYFWESNFYDLKQDKLLYSVQTQSFDPVSASELAHEYGSRIIANMIENKVIEKQVSGVARVF